MEALPCPFCGCSSIKTRQGSTHRWHVAYCTDCDAQGPETRLTALDKEDPDTNSAIEAWNLRMDPELVSRNPVPVPF